MSSASERRKELGELRTEFSEVFRQYPDLAKVKELDYSFLDAIRKALKKERAEKERKQAEQERATRELGEERAPFLANCARSLASPYRAQDGRIYIEVPSQGVRLITSFDVRNWLTALYVERTRGKGPTAGLVTQAITILQAKPIDGYTLAVRMAVEFEGGEPQIYLDLNDDAGTTVRINADGWQVGERPNKILFRRPRTLGALPVPVHGGSLEELRPFLNLPNDEAWLLYKGVLLATLCPFETSYPFLILNGPAGAAKSTTARFTRALIDPSTDKAGGLRAMPKDERDLLIAAGNSILPVFDNVSHMSTWLSDAFCRLATGSGMSTRTLFTESDESVLSAMRPVIINGIEDFGTREDFLKRVVILRLPVIPERERKSEYELRRDFQAAHARILGALLTKVSTALANYAATALRLEGKERARLVDFAIFSTAGLDDEQEGSFLDAYRKNIRLAQGIALDSSPVATAIQALMRDREQWKGTASELLGALSSLVTPAQRVSKAWPVDATRLSGTIRRAENELLSIGLRASFSGGTQRAIKLVQIPDAD